MDTFYLFLSPSFRSGVARVLDMFGLYDSYNVSRTPDGADLTAIRSDWAALGTDFRAAVKALDAETGSCGSPTQLRMFGANTE